MTNSNGGIHIASILSWLTSNSSQFFGKHLTQWRLDWHQERADCDCQAVCHNEAAINDPIVGRKFCYPIPVICSVFLCRTGRPRQGSALALNVHDLRNGSSLSRRPLLFADSSIVMTGASTHSCHLVLQTLHKSIWKHGTGFGTFAVDAKKRWPLGQCTTTCSWPNDQSSGSMMSGNMLNGKTMFKTNHS